MENQNTMPTFFEKNAALIKGFFVGFLILILLIPTFMIEALIRERQDRAKEVVAEVSSKWGNSQQLIGPILRIPYYQINKIEKVNASNSKEVELTKKLEYAYYLPEKLKITGNITPELRSRGIFDVTVYRSKINFEGKFEDFGPEKLNILPENILWNEAKVLLNQALARRDLRERWKKAAEALLREIPSKAPTCRARMSSQPWMITPKPSPGPSSSTPLG